MMLCIPYIARGIVATAGKTILLPEYPFPNGFTKACVRIQEVSGATTALLAASTAVLVRQDPRASQITLDSTTATWDRATRLSVDLGALVGVDLTKGSRGTFQTSDEDALGTLMYDAQEFEGQTITWQLQFVRDATVVSGTFDIDVVLYCVDTTSVWAPNNLTNTVTVS